MCMCVCACVCTCVRARACVCVCADALPLSYRGCSAFDYLASREKDSLEAVGKETAVETVVRKTFAVQEFRLKAVKESSCV